MKTFITLLLLFLSNSLVVYSQSRGEKNLLANTVKIEVFYKEDFEGDGFGFIVESFMDSVYIVTTAHTCKAFTMGLDSVKIKIKFINGQQSLGRVVYISPRIEEFDVAIIKTVADPPFESYNNLFKTVWENQNVSFIGVDGRWEFSRYKGPIIARNNLDFTVATNQPEEGNSGGPVVFRNKIGGMLIMDNSNEYIAHPIDTLVQLSDLEAAKEALKFPDHLPISYSQARQLGARVKTLRGAINAAQTADADGEIYNNYFNGVNLAYSVFYSHRVSISGNFNYSLSNYEFGGNEYKTSIIGLNISCRLKLAFLPPSKFFWKRQRLNPNIFVGIGADYIAHHAHKQDDGVRYSPIQPVIHYGLGTEIKVSDRIDVIIDGISKNYFSDYIYFGREDIPVKYPAKDQSFTMIVGLNYYFARDINEKKTKKDK